MDTKTNCSSSNRLYQMMKTAIVLVGLLMSLAACQTEQESTVESWWINTKKVECMGVAPMMCYQYSKAENLQNPDWQLFYSEIEGFDYEPGNIYQIKVKITSREEPVPADASSKKYSLIEILSKTSVNTFQNIPKWQIIEVGNIKNPVSERNGEKLIFEFNTAEMRYSGNLSCNITMGAIERLDDSTLLLKPGATTRVACQSMQTEEAIEQALNKIRSYQVVNDQLHLLDEEAQILMKLIPAAE